MPIAFASGRLAEPSGEGRDVVPHQGDEPVSFGILGPLTVTFGSLSVPINAARHQVVLSMLLLEAGRVVPIQRLAEALWGGEPPSTARGQVQICISMLRKLLAGTGSSLDTRPPGYVLTVPERSLDRSRFTDLAAMAGELAGRQPEEAVARYREALALWRGVACSGIESQIVEHVAIRLNEERWSAIEACLELELRLGRHNQVTGELAGLVAAEPFRERPRALLMIALYRAGRQAEALEVYRSGRELFVEQLGADPGKELQAIEQAILTGDSALDLAVQPRLAVPARTVPDPEQPASCDGATVQHPSQASSQAQAQVPRPAHLPSGIADFVGRRNVIQEIAATLQAGGDRGFGHVATVLLTGRGGIGKTTLAVRVAHAVRDSFPDGQLVARLGGVGNSAATPDGALELFLRSLGVPPGLIPDGLTERSVMFRSCVADRRVLIVLDDVMSLNDVEALLPGGPGCAVIMTSRTRLPGPAGAARYEVDLLDDEAAAELLDSVIGRTRTEAEPVAVHELIRLCEGLPLALRIVASKLATRGHWRIGKMVERLADERRRLDELYLEGASIRATLELCYETLSEDAQRLLERLGLLDGADYPYWISAPLADRSLSEAEDILEELVAAGFVEARALADGTVRFRLHDTVRLFAREKLARRETAERLAAVRRYTGCWLRLVSEAHRSYHGGDFYVVHGRDPGWLLPGGNLAAMLEAPLQWLHQERRALVEAIMLAARTKLDDICWDLAVTSVTLFELGLYSADWAQTHEAALVATSEAGNDRGTAALLYSLGLCSMGRNLDQCRDYLRRSLTLWERLRDQHGRGLALAGLAGADRLAGRHDAAKEGYARALDFFTQAGDLAGQASALRGVGQVDMDRQCYAAARDLLERSVAVATVAGARRDITQSWYYLAELQRRQGDFAGAERSLRQIAAETRIAGDVVGEGYCLLGLGVIHVQSDDLVTAGKDLDAARILADQSGDALLSGQALLASAEVAARHGSLDSGRRWLAGAVSAFALLGSPSVWEARCCGVEALIRKGEGKASRFVAPETVPPRESEPA